MNFSPFGGIMFTLVPILFMLVFGLVFGILVARLFRGGKQWNKNNQSPVLTVDTVVVTKRSDIHYYNHNSAGNDMHHTSSSTTYYATFQVASGDRLELVIPDTEYGMLVEQDRGKLTFQGTRYLSFERTRPQQTSTNYI